jgi:hypothetical protein
VSETIDLAPSCANCRYSVMLTTEPNGTCNRHAPRPLIGLEASDWTAWPQIHGSDWCGEWDLPPTDDELFADYLARSTDTLPTFGGIPVLPIDDNPEPTAPEFTTYDDPYSDPLR